MKRLLYFLLIGTCVLGSVACGSKEELSLKAEEFKVEYGKKLSMKASTYLDTKDKDILDSAKVVFKEKDTEGKDYPEVGAYMGEITYKEDGKEKTKKLVVRVKDTVKPKFEEFKDTINLEKGTTLDVDLRKYYFAQDLSDVSIKVDTSKVDFDKAGEYPIIITASDAHKNKVSKNAKVVIFEKAKQVVEPTPEPTYACPDALYDKNKTCDYIPDSVFEKEPTMNFMSEAERTKYIEENGLNVEDYYLGFYTIKNNGKEDVMVWYMLPGTEQKPATVGEGENPKNSEI